jgi:antagonist of KipI
MSRPAGHPDGQPAKVLLVEQPGLFTTIQDLGRPGRNAAGVPQGGAMDRFALAAANLLVGNPEGAAGLECALSGPTLVVLRSCLVAITGADFDARLNGRPLPLWTSVFLCEGDRLSFGGRRWGARVYVAVAGGLSGERWLGSASTYLLVGRGGLGGRSLKAGDELLAWHPGSPAVVDRSLAPHLLPPYSKEPDLAAVAGPHLEMLSSAGRRRLFGESWKVSRDADRMGYRLEGPDLEVQGEELISFGLAPGCVQAPRSGQPILLMADHQTAGGYPVVAAVARADRPLAAQVLPGERVRFRQVTVDQAQELWRQRRKVLDNLRG